MVLFLLAALLLAAAAAWRNLPFIVSRWVLPRLETSLEARIRTDVVRCDASGLMLRNLSFHSALFRFNADEIVAAWRLSDLRRGTINHLRVQGGRLEFSVPFPPSPTPLILTPFAIRKLEVVDASIAITLPPVAGKPRMKLDLAGLSGQTPVYHLRDVDAPADGFVTLDALLLDGVRLASASGTLRAGNSSIRVQGRFDADAGLARAAHADVQGTVDFPSPSDPKLDFAFTAPAFPLDPAAPALAHFLGAPLPVAASATAAVSGRLTGSGQHPVLPVKLVLSEGRIDGGEGKFAATGVRAALESADLFALESAPAQELAVDTLTAGAMAFSKLRMLFRVEPAGVLFVEEGAVSWWRLAAPLRDAPAVGARPRPHRLPRPAQAGRAAEADRLRGHQDERVPQRAAAGPVAGRAHDDPRRGAVLPPGRAGRSSRSAGPTSSPPRSTPARPPTATSSSRRPPSSTSCSTGS
ncbi:MAG: hypothetical protein U1G05_09805 [Kiritimatiellia bacterium]